MSYLQRRPMYTCGLPLFKRHAVHSRSLPVPAAMRRLLYRTVDHQPDSWYAQWQAGRRTLRAIGRGRALPHLRATRAAGLLRRTATVTRNVWRYPRAGDGLVERTGTADGARARVNTVA